MPRTTSITLGTHQQQFIEALVRSGRYTSTSEIVRDAIEGEKGEARAWDDEDLLANVKKEAARRGNL